MAGQLNLGGRVMPGHGPQSGNSLLSMQHDQFANPMYPQQHMPEDEWKIPTIVDHHTASLPGSAYGSPQAEGMFAKSPANGLSVLDAPLPASFDSQGVSIFARHGPIAASVPSRFGFDSSPPPSLPNNRPTESAALRNLHSSAFGDSSRNLRGFGTSPSINEESAMRMPLRQMHSERYQRPRMLSASVGARHPFDQTEGDWDDDLVFEEDLLPNTLNDLLTPQERLRRLSRTADEDQQPLSNHRSLLSNIGTPSGESPKVGSPGTLSSSPSRFGPLFARQQREKSSENVPTESAFGHVGSPLRPSPLNPGSSPSLRPSAHSRPASGDFSVSSPPRQASMSMISQQLQRARLNSRASETSDPGTSSNPPSTSTSTAKAIPAPPAASSAPHGRLDRTVSGGVSRGDKIDEEPEELFTMDEINNSSKRYSGAAQQGAKSNGNVWATPGSGVAAVTRGASVMGKTAGNGQA